MLVGKRPAERTAGCTHVVYLAPNTYELSVVAMVEQSGLHQVTRHDFVYDHGTRRDFEHWLADDKSDV